MIIHEVEMQNIRSYEHVRINFPRGTILFEGDIGSGKTTILMAIEFAIFGESTGNFYEKLLRKGSRMGFVRVKFEVNGGTYEIYRSLVKKGKGINNAESYVINPDGKKRYLTSREIRSYVLRLIGLNVSGKRRKSLPIVTYAIYTPQETMKSILEGDDEERLEVIRKIFRLDEYRTAKDNIDILLKNIDTEIKTAKNIREEVEGLKTELSNLEEEKNELTQRKKELEILRNKKEREWSLAKKEFEEWDGKRKMYNDLERRFVQLRAFLEKAEVELKNLIKEKEELLDVEKEVKSLEKFAKRYEELKDEIIALEPKVELTHRLEREYAKIEERLENHRRELEEAEKIKKDIVNIEEEIKNISAEIEKLGNLDAQRDEIESNLRNLHAQLSTLKAKLREKEEERKQLESLGAVCPTCKRPLSFADKRVLIEKNGEEINRILEDIKQVEKNLEEMESLYRSVREKERKKRMLEVKRAEMEEKRKTLKRRIEELNRKQELMNALAEQREKMHLQLKSLRALKERYEKLREDMKNLEPQWRKYISLMEKVKRKSIVDDKINALRREIEDARKNLKGLKSEIEKLGYSEEKYAEVRDIYRNVEVELAKVKQMLTSIESDIVKIGHLIEERKKLIDNLREKIENAEKLKDIKVWLEEKFRIALEDIEKNRLARINEEFRMLFEEWFHELLGESDYSATVDENFRPVVRYESYDMPLGTLSGGERTSVALAYRLALNTMVKRALGLDNNLLILDEPTDGFSKDQLFKLKDILEKIDADQIIIVSHEKELRNVADTVFLVHKQDGVSRVTQVSQ